MNCYQVLTTMLAAAAVAACGSAKSTQRQPDTPYRQPGRSQTTGSLALARSDRDTADIKVAEDIRQACGLSILEARFAYDSAQIQDRDRSILAKIAQCFSGGPLKGREMRLVGHADPRGEESYNLVLGQARADNIKRALVGVGMIWHQISTTSRGEFDASGMDESGWARDRRVDIMLAD